MRWEFFKLTKFVRLTMLLFVLLIASNCVNFSKSSIGYIVVSAKFPQSSFKIKTIPIGTVRIGLEITGDGVSQPMNFTLTPTTSSLTIPAIKGNKNLSATAFNTSGNILAFGKNSLYVYPDLHNKVEIILVEGAYPDNNITGSSIPTSSPSGSDSSASATPTPDTTMPIDNGSSPANTNPSISPSPTDSPVPTPTISPTPTPTPTSYSNNPSTYFPAINVNANIVASTPIPSGISLGMLGP